MSALLAVAVQAVVTATSTPTPTPEVIQAATPHVNTFLDTLNGLAGKVSQNDLIALAAAAAVSLQALLNKAPLFKSAVEHVQDAKRFLLAVALPTVMTVGASFASGNNDLHLMPAVFLVGQLLFYVVRFLVGAAVSALSKDDSPVVTEGAVQF